MNAKVLLLTAGLLLIARDERPSLEQPAARPAPVPVAPSRPAAVRALRLAPGILDEAPLRGGDERAYLFDLAAGQSAELVVDQQGIDVEVRLRASDGRTLVSVDGPNGTVGPEPLPFVAETAGRFRLEIRSLAPGVPAGRYVLRLDALRPATAGDRARVEAERWLASVCRDGTLAAGRNALGRFRALGLPDREAETLFCLGASYERAGDREPAARFYREALARFEALGDKARTGSTLINLGSLERTGGRPERALALYRQALPLLRQARNRPEEARALSNIGRAATERGESGEALSALAQAVALWRDLGSRDEQGNTLSNLGFLEIFLGQTAQALADLGQAVALLETAGDRGGLGVALERLGVARGLGGRPRGEVLAAFQRALRLQRAGGGPNEAVTLHNLGWYFLREGEIHQAERIFRETLAKFEALGERAHQAGALLSLGGIDLDLGRLEEAEESFTRARSLLREIGDPAKEANALFGLARVRRVAGRPAEALALLEGAVSRIETLRRKPPAPELRQTFFASKQDIYGLGIDLLMDLHQPEQALAASEDARARTLLDLLDEAHVGSGPRGAELPQPRTARYQEIQREIVEPGSLILEYYLGRERSFLWAVTPGAIETFELPAREVLDAEARRAAFLLGASNKAEARRQATIALADLSQELLAPVAHRLRDAKRVVIVPDGALWYVSFAALPDPGVGGPAGARPPLVAGHEIVTLPSLAALPRLRKSLAGRRPAPGTVAVVADPVFSAKDPRVIHPPVSGDASSRSAGPEPRLARLPFSRAEAEAILAVAPPRGRLAALDFAASRETVASGRLAQHRIVHFATHAVVNTEHPELSGIALSMVDPQGRPRDGFLRLAEIYRLDLPADLVVLSACRTALGQEIRGEGLVGLTRGFFSAGARQVLVSLWPVEDRATAELMRRFYRALLGEGRTPAAALREAQTSMWRDESWRDPVYWAGFILQGDWRVPANKPSPRPADL